MSSGQRKNSRTRTKSGAGRTNAMNKTRRSPSKGLARTAEHVKKQSIKPHDPRPRPRANGSAGHDLRAEHVKKNKAARPRPRPHANGSAGHDLRAEHVKKQPMKPHDQRPRPAANGPPGHDLNAISNSTSSLPVTLVGKKTEIVALRTPAAATGISDLRSANAGLRSFSPLAMLLRQQELLTSVMLNVMRTQQQWARSFSSLPWRTA